VHAYSAVLFVHLLGLLVATGAAVLTFFAALHLRGAETTAEVARWAGVVKAVVPAFPVATLLLLGSGAYLTQVGWRWTTPWIDAGLAGLALIVACGPGIEAARGRALEQEVRTAGMTARSRALLRDPLAWSAKLTTMTLMLAIVFLMVVKPAALGSGLALVVALVLGPLGAVPFWRGAERGEVPPRPATRVDGEPVAAAATPAPRTER
jgi:MFS family permease